MLNTVRPWDFLVAPFFDMLRMNASLGIHAE